MERDELAHRVGKVIRRYREAEGMSQDRFADKIGMHRAYFAAIERGEKNVTLWTLRRVAEGLRLNCSTLLNDAEV